MRRRPWNGVIDFFISPLQPWRRKHGLSRDGIPHTVFGNLVIAHPMGRSDQELACVDFQRRWRNSDVVEMVTEGDYPELVQRLLEQVTP